MKLRRYIKDSQGFCEAVLLTIGKSKSRGVNDLAKGEVVAVGSEDIALLRGIASAHNMFDGRGRGLKRCEIAARIIETLCRCVHVWIKLRYLEGEYLVKDGGFETKVRFDQLEQLAPTTCPWKRC